MPSVPTVHNGEDSDSDSSSSSSSDDSTWGAASLSHQDTAHSWEETPDESSPDKERQLLLLMLLAQVCALHDPTPRTFIVHVLELFERSILDRDSIRFLFELGLVPHHSTLPKQPLLLENDEITNALLARTSPKNDGRPTVRALSPTPPSLAEPTTRTQEASAIRSHLQETTTAEAPTTHPTTNDTPSHSWAVEQYPLSLSRYQREFRQIKLLNRGGFGAVYQARNVMDGHNYAIKRVAFEGCGYSTQQIVEAIREVQCLAQCDHANCVRYYTSWLEPSWMTGSNASTVEQSASQRPMLMGVSNTDASSSRLPRRFSFSAEDSCWEDTTHDSAAYWLSRCSKDDSYLHRTSSPTDQAMPRSRYRYEICLYIQMQLCHPTTLADWIRRRNSSAAGDSTSSADQALDIFRQIASGIAHVHEKGILHRDLKPANIFAGTDGLFKIGDFGLSKLLAQQRGFSSADTTAVTTALVAHHHRDALTTGIGTASYAAPEQLDNSSQTPYGPQADVFSMGLILLELVCCFGTEHERLVSFRDLRRQGTLPEWLSEQYPEIASLIVKCTHPDPSKRPTAHDLVKMTIVPTAELENDTLLKQKDRELERQRSEIEEKDRIIEDLRRQVDRMSGVLLQNNGDLADDVTRNDDDNQEAASKES